MTETVVEKESDALVEEWRRMFKPLSEQFDEWIPDGPNTLELGAFCGFVVTKTYNARKKNQTEASLVIERFQMFLNSIIVDAIESSLEEANISVPSRKDLNVAYWTTFSERYQHYANELKQNVHQEEDFFKSLAAALCSVLAEVHGKPPVGKKVFASVLGVIKLTYCMMVIRLDEIVKKGFLRRLFS